MSEPKAYNFEVKVLLLRENETWIAQGLDYDITGHGNSPDAALDNFGKTILGQVILDLSSGQEPLASVPKAPDFYWRRFNEAAWRRDEKRFKIPEETRFKLPEETPPAYIISAVAAETRMDFS